ncbi:hypothetical protein BH23PLA1_BH23PLA1_38390 [soil metagenome]
MSGLNRGLCRAPLETRQDSPDGRKGQQFAMMPFPKSADKGDQRLATTSAPGEPA